MVLLTVTSKLNSLVLAILAAVALIIAGILGATSHAVPTQLWTIIYVLVGGAAGVTLPSVVTTTAPPTPPTP
jgi:hypothetical protein